MTKSAPSQYTTTTAYGTCQAHASSVQFNNSPTVAIPAPVSPSIWALIMDGQRWQPVADTWAKHIIGLIRDDNIVPVSSSSSFHMWTEEYLIDGYTYTLTGQHITSGSKTEQSWLELKVKCSIEPEYFGHPDRQPDAALTCLDSTQYMSIINAISDLTRSKELTRADIVLYNVVRVLPINRGFTPVTNPGKIKGGHARIQYNMFKAIAMARTMPIEQFQQRYGQCFTQQAIVSLRRAIHGALIRLTERNIVASGTPPMNNT